MDIREFVDDYVNKVSDDKIAEINEGMVEYLRAEGYMVTKVEYPMVKLSEVNHELGLSHKKIGHEIYPVDEDGNFVDTLDQATYYYILPMQTTKNELGFTDEKVGY